MKNGFESFVKRTFLLLNGFDVQVEEFLFSIIHSSTAHIIGLFFRVKWIYKGGIFGDDSRYV